MIKFSVNKISQYYFINWNDCITVPESHLALIRTHVFFSPGPPSPPRDLLYSLKQSTLILEWAAPSDTGGRVDLTYSVGCKRCSGRQCEPCGASIGFVPQQVGLTERTVTVVNLLPNTNYTFTVEALNGVSELLPNKRFYTQVNVSTSLPGEWRLQTGCSRQVFLLVAPMYSLWMFLQEADQWIVFFKAFYFTHKGSALKSRNILKAHTVCKFY